MLYRRSIKMASNSKENMQNTEKHRTQKKINSLKEQVRNADLHKFVLNKIMTTHK